MDVADLTQLWRLGAAHQWLAFATLACATFGRLTKQDARFLPDVSARWRPLVLLVPSILLAGLRRYAAAGSWADAIEVAVGAPALATLAHTYGVHVVLNGREFPLPARARRVAKQAAAVALVLMVSGCVALRSAVPILSQADAIGRGVSHLLGWCEDNKVSPAAIAEAERELAAKNYAAAIAAFEPALTRAIQRGDVSEDVQAEYQLARGMAAAYAVEQGMRALSGRQPDGSARP